jgi:hypothetical protein
MVLGKNFFVNPSVKTLVSVYVENVIFLSLAGLCCCHRCSRKSFAGLQSIASCGTFNAHISRIGSVNKRCWCCVFHSISLNRSVAKELGLELFEVPTGWKYFGNIMDAFEKQGAPLGVICGVSGEFCFCVRFKCAALGRKFRNWFVTHSWEGWSLVSDGLVVNRCNVQQWQEVCVFVWNLHFSKNICGVVNHWFQWNQLYAPTGKNLVVMYSHVTIMRE